MGVVKALGWEGALEDKVCCQGLKVSSSTGKVFVCPGLRAHSFLSCTTYGCGEGTELGAGAGGQGALFLILSSRCYDVCLDGVIARSLPQHMGVVKALGWGHVLGDKVRFDGVKHQVQQLCY
jgi:hypothetical protein